MTAKQFYFQEGITYNKASSRGNSFRLLETDIIFDSSGTFAFLKTTEISLNYLLALMNSKLVYYILSCLNPTVSSQVGDIKRVPIAKFNSQEIISIQIEQILEIKKTINSNNLIEPNFKESLFYQFKNYSLKDSLFKFFNYENHLSSQILLNEAIINEKIFEVYDLTEADKAMVLAKEGESIGALPVSAAAKAAYLANEVARTSL